MRTKRNKLFEVFSEISLQIKAFENIFALTNLEKLLHRLCRISHLVHMKSSQIEKKIEVLHD